MALFINDVAPDFEAESTQGMIHFHEWMSTKWTVLFTNPRAFGPLCTSELAQLATRQADFARRGVQLIGVGADTVPTQQRWTDDLRKAGGSKVTFPMIGDPQLKVISLYGMLAADKEAGVTTYDSRVRMVFIIGPDKRIKMMLAHPMETARNFDEILRVIDSIQLTARYKAKEHVNPRQHDRSGTLTIRDRINALFQTTRGQEREVLNSVPTTALQEQATEWPRPRF